VTVIGRAGCGFAADPGARGGTVGATRHGSQTGGVRVRPRWRTPAGHDPLRRALGPVRS